MIYGAKNAMWAKMTTDTDATALPKYDTEIIEFDGINESNDSPTFAEASAYGDNVKKLAVREFSGGTIETKAVNITAAQRATMLGTSTDSEDGLFYGGEDDAPFGGYGFVTSKLDSNKVKYYRAIFYPKVQAYVEGEDHKTKEDSITMEYDSMSFNWFQPECGMYRVTKDFSTEAQAVAYLKSLFGGEVTVPEANAEG